jgi:hypothetical protein
VRVAGYPEPLPLLPPERGVNVLSLVSEKTMYSVSQSDQLDEALELAAPLNAGPAASAAAGAWAAIESLLYHPGDQADVKEGNLQRSEVITKALSTGTALALDSPSDVAAAERMKAVLGAPDPQLQNVSRIIQGVFRRPLSAAQRRGSRRQHRSHRPRPSPTDSSAAHRRWP